MNKKRTLDELINTLYNFKLDNALNRHNKCYDCEYFVKNCEQILSIESEVYYYLSKYRDSLTKHKDCDLIGKDKQK